MITLPKPVIVIAVGSTVVLAGLITALFFQKPKSPAPTVVPSSTPTVTPRADADPKTAPNPAEEQDTTLNAHNQNPVLKVLPKYTVYWTLKLDGSPVQAPLKLTAEVYYKLGTDAKQEIEKQKAYINDFIKSTGQVDGTYQVTYSSKQVQRD